MVLEKYVLNIDSSMAKSAQAVDKVVFHDFVIDLVSGTRFENSYRSVVFVTVIWAVKMHRDMFIGLIVDVHEMFTETICQLSASFPNIGRVASFTDKGVTDKGVNEISGLTFD